MLSAAFDDEPPEDRPLPPPPLRLRRHRPELEPWAWPGQAHPRRDAPAPLRGGVAGPGPGAGQQAALLYEFMGREFALGHVALADAELAAMLASLVARGEAGGGGGPTPSGRACWSPCWSAPWAATTTTACCCRPEEGGYRRAAAAIHRRRRSWAALVRAAVADGTAELAAGRAAGARAVFGLVRSLMADAALGEEAKSQVRETTLGLLPELMPLSSRAPRRC